MPSGNILATCLDVHKKVFPKPSEIVFRSAYQLIIVAECVTTLTLYLIWMWLWVDGSQTFIVSLIQQFLDLTVTDDSHCKFQNFFCHFLGQQALHMSLFSFSFLLYAFIDLITQVGIILTNEWAFMLRIINRSHCLCVKENGRYVVARSTMTSKFFSDIDLIHVSCLDSWFIFKPYSWKYISCVVQIRIRKSGRLASYDSWRPWLMSLRLVFSHR
jgi:hypothetical protein